MEKKVYYNVYRILYGKKEFIATYTDAESAHEAAQRYNTPFAILTIEKTSIPRNV